MSSFEKEEVKFYRYRDLYLNTTFDIDLPSNGLWLRVRYDRWGDEWSLKDNNDFNSEMNDINKIEDKIKSVEPKLKSFNTGGNLWNLRLKQFADFYFSRAVIENNQFKIFIDCVKFSPKDFYVVGTFHKFDENPEERLNQLPKVCYPATTKIIEYLKIYNNDLFSRLVDNVDVSNIGHFDHDPFSGNVDDIEIITFRDDILKRYGAEPYEICGPEEDESSGSESD